MTRVRSHYRKTLRGYTSVRSHYRRSKKPKLNFIRNKKGAFIAGGFSKKYGPYLTVGYKKDSAKIKTSIGLQGHKVSSSFKLTRHTEVGVTHNLTFNKTNLKLRNKKREIVI